MFACPSQSRMTCSGPPPSSQREPASRRRSWKCRLMPRSTFRHSGVSPRLPVDVYSGLCPCAFSYGRLPRPREPLHPLPDVVAEHVRLRRVLDVVRTGPPHGQGGRQTRRDGDPAVTLRLRLLRRQDELLTRLRPDLVPLQGEQLPFSAPGLERRLHDAADRGTARREQPLRLPRFEPPAPLQFPGQLHRGHGAALERRLFEVVEPDGPVEACAQQ